MKIIEIYIDLFVKQMKKACPMKQAYTCECWNRISKFYNVEEP